MKHTLSSLFSRFFSSYTVRSGSSPQSRTQHVLGNIDWILFFSTLPLLGAGLLTMNSFTGDSQFFVRQLIWILIAITIFFILSTIDFRFLRKRWVSVSLFVLSCATLIVLYLVGKVTHGSISWFHLGLFSLQPSDPIKLVVIIIFSKYFSRRHIEIANVKHILISGLYAFVIFLLIIIQPDFGSAIIIFFIWFGMLLVSGISKRHLWGMTMIGIIVFSGLWFFGFKDYQRDRIKNFIYPLADIHDTGYNAYQSTIAVGSGQLLGKGVGYGTQSRLRFLPEYQTDFIFAAFAEEWGFVGVIILFGLYAVIIWRIILISLKGASNFEMLFGAGMAIFLIVHFLINVGMNMQLLPVTGQTLPFISYGGSHLVTEFAGLGILMGMRRYRHVGHREITRNEFSDLAA